MKGSVDAFPSSTSKMCASLRTCAVASASGVRIVFVAEFLTSVMRSGFWLDSTTPKKLNGLLQMAAILVLCEGFD